jgi:GT2 family glycosyltransferase
MQPRVTAILVVRNREKWLDRTLSALATQTRPADDFVLVDAGSTDGTAARLTAASPTRFVEAPALSLGAAIGHGVKSLAPAESTDEWLWLLTADTAPEPQALARLLAAVEVAPSVAIAGPKLVDADDRGILRSYGESITRFGATVPLVDGELDQAQYDVETDVLGVTSSAMLVRRVTWSALGGFDPGLPTADAGLDFAIRARLAGSRVIRVPDARVSRGERVEDFGRRRPLSERGRARVARAAQLHRRLTYAPGGALVFDWLMLVPLAVLRSIGHLLGKRPGLIGGELAAAFAAAFDGTVPAARSRLRRSRTVGWPALAPLRVTTDELRERRAASRERGGGDRDTEPDLVRASFLSGGGAWIVLVAALLGLGLWWRLVGESVISGGALLPIGADVGTLWSRLEFGPRDGAVGLFGPADPFLAVVAVLGSLTAWSPSLSLVLLWIIALPLGALGAWWAATRLSERRWPPIVAAVLWMLAPALLAALGEGRPAAVLVHVLLPFLVLAGIESARSWSAAATAALLFAAVVACAPVLTPALLVMVVAWAATHPRGIPRIVGIVIPAAALFAPLAITQLLRGSPLGLLADPGPAVPVGKPSGWQLLIGHPAATSDGWQQLAASLGLPGQLGVLAPVVLLAPLAVVALLALFLPGTRRAVPSLVVALLGLATAIASAHLVVAADGSAGVTPWPGTGLSLYWLGLVAAAVVALEALGRAALLTGLAVVLAAAAAVAPLLIAPPTGAATVVAGTGQLLPALVGADADARPGIGTLVLTAQGDGSLAATVARGAGTTIDETSTLATTRVGVDAADGDLAELAGNLASRSGYDPTDELQKLQIAFVVLPAASGPAAAAVRQRTAEALDASPDLAPVGDTALWRYPALKVAVIASPAPSAIEAAAPAVQLVIVAIALLLAIPTRRRRRTVRTSGPREEDPADTFEEDENG